jgi:methylated-DNA-[protein]-cysteine S-methyltransferase
LGPIWIAVSEQGLVSVEFETDEASFTSLLQKRFRPGVSIAKAGEKSSSRLEAMAAQAVNELGDYLEGKRRDFDLPIDWSVMRPFQANVLRLTYAIPYGQVSTYGEIARQVGKPRAARAVGRAEATNPMPLVIPCHRVVGSDGELHGYGGPGGIPTKARLLKMEKDRG